MIFLFNDPDPQAQAAFALFTADAQQFIGTFRSAADADDAKAQLLRLFAALGNDEHRVAVEMTLEAMNSETVLKLYSAMPHLLAIVLDELDDALLIEPMEQNKTALFSIARPTVCALLTLSFFGRLPVDAARFELAPLFYAYAVRPAEAAKLDCIVHYFWRVAALRADEPAWNAFAAQRVLVKREALSEDERGALHWSRDDTPLCAVDVVARDEQTGGFAAIERFRGAAQADFANKWIGGGVLTGGCVQEEIRFAVSTECLIALLVSPVMLPNEAIVIEGASQWSHYKGYGRSLEFDGDCVDETPVRDDNVVDVTIVCIDAADYRRGGALTQVQEQVFRRELHKVYVGLRNCGRAAFATGNLGCGVFQGNLRHKFVLQWMATTAAGLERMIYLPFGERGAVQDLATIRAALDQKTVADAYRLVLAFDAHVQSLIDAESAAAERTGRRAVRPKFPAFADFCRKFAAGDVAEDSSDETTVELDTDNV